MMPVTRSANPISLSTSSKAKPRSSVGTTTDLSTPGTSPRRTPHCKTCHRPRQGHPRSGCPYIEPTMSDQTSGATEDIVDELSSLRIVNSSDERSSLSTETPTQSKHRKRRLSVRFALLPAGSLASLSTTSSEIVERLLQPGMMSNVSDDDADDDDGDGDGQRAIMQWKRTLTSPESPPEDTPELSSRSRNEPYTTSHPSSGTGLSRRMPCTLRTPTPSLVSTEPLSSHPTSDSVDMNRTIFLDPDSERKPNLLARTMSADERSLFLDNLTQSSGVAPAMLFSVPLIDLKAVQYDAEKLGFSVRVLPNGSSREHRWVILAKEGDAAEFLEQRLTEEEEKGRKAKGNFGVAAGGALVGAVATFTGLAFS
ncbi:hypothetical protein DFJ58DRAFT_910429 [Suillus subalutaceus]|uniref:uncharacterized protein n=1 Tax=Suillus subalutaceus TaxID=48586 RepID=UPI001B87CC94|nr:uncharacterized protein DFJ58DRAFT_910429 [Suillus subalutaceus]KAG1873676.1 hypothetical protein DFJ58DRAFT_910429 [Suillus subalutaceus]